MKLRPYPEYKDSGVPWLSDIPKDWKFLRGKVVFRPLDVRSETGSEELLSVSERQGVSLRRNTDVTMFQAESYKGYKLCWPGDLVINSLWAWQQGLGFSEYHGIVSTAYGVYRPVKEYVSDYHFFNYLLRSAAYKWELRVRSKGIWRSRYQLNDDDFLTMPILVPSKEEQTQIARFLDWKTAQIDRFIRAKRQLIERLKEQKQVLINQAVTGAIDVRTGKPYPEYKDSGAPWLGKVPSNWNIKRLKSLCRNINEQTSEKAPDEVYIALENVESWTGRVTFPDGEIAFESLVKKFQHGDVLFGKLRPYLAKVTSPSVSGVCVGEFLVLRVMSNELLGDFLEYKLRSKQIIDLVNSSTYGAKMPRADWTFIGNIRFSYPSRKEQEAIVSYIQRISNSVDTAITRTQREIDLIQEYRTRLIADVVTGKLDVRDIEVPEVDESEDALDEGVTAGDAVMQDNLEAAM